MESTKVKYLDSLRVCQIKLDNVLSSQPLVDTRERGCLHDRILHSVKGFTLEECHGACVSLGSNYMLALPRTGFDCFSRHSPQKLPWWTGFLASNFKGGTFSRLVSRYNKAISAPANLIVRFGQAPTFSNWSASYPVYGFGAHLYAGYSGMNYPGPVQCACQKGGCSPSFPPSLSVFFSLSLSLSLSPSFITSVSDSISLSLCSFLSRSLFVYLYIELYLSVSFSPSFFVPPPTSPFSPPLSCVICMDILSFQSVHVRQSACPLLCA